jgi:CRP-like cAMP-binding protein
VKPNEDTVIRVRSAYGRTLEPGDAVFDEGDPGDHLYVIQSGEIELKREGPSGHHVVAQLGPGDFFGELSLVPGQRRNARAVAVKTTRVLQLDRDTLEAMCLAQPEFAMRMIRLLVSRLIEAERRLAMLGVDDGGRLPLRHDPSAPGGAGRALHARSPPGAPPAPRPPAAADGGGGAADPGPGGPVRLSRRARVSPAGAPAGRRWNPVPVVC